MGFWPFLNFINTNIIGGCHCNTGGVLGVGATHLVRCGKFCIYLRVMSKMHLSRFWPNYLLF